MGAQRFDYFVIDEVHHAAADSYRRTVAALDARFLLGLTATPDRADAADILGLFDDHLAFSADLVAGIGLGRLVQSELLQRAPGTRTIACISEPHSSFGRELTVRLARGDHMFNAVAIGPRLELVTPRSTVKLTLKRL